MKIKIIFFILFISTICFSDTISLSLLEAIKIGLKNNLDILVSEYNIKIQENNIHKREADFSPYFSTNISYREYENQTGEYKNINITNTISKKFESGNEISLNHQLNKLENSSVNYTSSLSLNYNMPILKDRGSKITKTFLYIEKNNKEISEYELKNKIRGTIKEILKNYWEIIYNKELINVKKQTLKLAEELYNNNTMKVKLGVLAPIEITSAAAGVAAQQEGIIIAENNLISSQNNFITKLNIQGDITKYNITLDLTDTPQINTEIPDVIESYKYALANNPDYLKLKKDIENSNLKIEYYKNQLLPEIDLVATLSANGINQNISKTYNSLFEPDYPDYKITLSFTMPIGKKREKAEYNNEELNKLKLIAQIKNFENELFNNILNSVKEIEATIKRVEAANKAVKLAEENLAGEMKRYELQQTTTYDILKFQEALDTARSKLLKAIIDNQNAVIEYSAITGKIFDKFNIIIK